jgi:ACS family glucarate transporter-like MFS transporter
VAAVVGLWSLFTALTAVVSRGGLLVAIRFLFGAAEAGAFPASARAIRSWLPASETGVAEGILFSGSRLGAAFGLTLTSWSVAALGWRSSFFALGAIGIAWMVGWLVFFRNRPEEARGVPEPERAYIRAGRAETPEAAAADWKSVFRLRETPALLAQYFASNFTFFLCYSWLLPYLRDQYRLSAADGGLFASVPLLFGAAANWSSGAIVDTLYRRNWSRQSRILPAAAGFLLGAAALVGAIHATTVWGAVAWFAIATFGVDLTLSPSWTLCIDIAGPSTGTLSGAMNMFGNIGSFASSVAFPLLLRWTGSSAAYFYSAAFINVLAALLWVSMRERKLGQ